VVYYVLQMSSLFLYWGVYVLVLSDFKCESYESQFRRVPDVEVARAHWKMYEKSRDSMSIL